MSKFIALILSAGLALGGWFVREGIINSRTADRFVTVKGVSERDVVANMALWPLRFVATENDLKLAQKNIETGKNAILKFLNKYNIDATQVELQELEVNDVLANPYRSGPINKRFIITQTLIVRSNNPEQIRTASQNVSELVDAGVVLTTSGHPGNGPTYLFTELTTHKPDMIAEATANARNAAEQFAKDSGSILGGIRRANQGLFVILPRDRAPGIGEGSQLNKTIRVVSTIEYYLED